MMRVVSPGHTGKIVGEKIIYVDSPEVRKQYADALTTVQQMYNREIAEKDKTLKELSEDLNRKVVQIDHYSKMVNQNIIPFPTQEVIDKPASDSSAVVEAYIKKLIAEIDAQSKQREALEAQLLEATQIKPEVVQLPPIGQPALPIVDDSFWRKINWRHVAIACGALAVIFKLGMMAGKV